MTDNAVLLNKLHSGYSDAENEIIKNNMGLVAGIAKRFFNRGYDADELIQVGCIGLLKAARRFDLDFNVKFSTYAVPLVLGEIKRFIRDDGIIKVSRTHKTNAMKAYAAAEKLTQTLNRIPTITEISAECRIPQEDILTAFEATAPPESIYQKSSSEDDDKEMIENLTASEQEGEIINRVIIKQSLEALNERERKIITMRYFGQKTQSQIAEIIGVSQVQISRLEKAALLKMRKFLA